MNAPPIMVLVEEELVTFDEEPRLEPKVFSRTIATPAALPWDQARSAHLDARLGAPLPLTEVTYQLRRLEPWAPGRPGRFAAFYVRTREVGARLDATVQVDGRPFEVSFLSAAEQSRRARRLAFAAAIGGLCVAPPVAVIWSAATKRAQIEQQLDSADQTAARKLKEAQDLETLKRQARLLNLAGGADRRLKVVLNDLAWASAARSADVKLEAIHWDRGYMAFEVRGETDPFPRVDRPVKKFDKPVRRGVWLWGVGPREKLKPGPRPVVAQPLDAPAKRAAR